MSTAKIAQVFITTLSDMLEDERQRKEARLRARHRAHAERFRQTFLAGPIDSGSSAEWTGVGAQTPERVVQRMLDQ